MNFRERYEIRSELARGGMGRILIAWDHQRGCEVVIKTLLCESDGEALDDKSRLRFEREARSLAALRHANILTIHDFGFESGQPYMVLPKVSGQDWAEILEQGPVPLERSLRILEQLAEALEFCHKAGLSHRDLKPANILIQEPDTDHEQVLLIDFGIARGKTSNLTRTGELLGTPLYMAPEVFEGNVADDAWPAVDVWSFGVLLYESLTGERPFDGTPLELVAAVSAATPKPPQRIRPDLPGWLVELCLACLRREGKDRPDFSEIRKTLQLRRLTIQNSLSISTVLVLGLIFALALAAILLLRPNRRPPVIDSIEIPELSHDPNIVIKGQAHEAQSIELMLRRSGARMELPVAPNGHFEGSIPIQEGLNEILVIARRDGLRSAMETRESVLDTVPPEEPLLQIQAAWGGRTELKVRGEKGARFNLANESWLLSGELQSFNIQLEAADSIEQRREEKRNWTLEDKAGNRRQGDILIDLRPSHRLTPSPNEEPGEALMQAIKKLPEFSEIHIPPGHYRCHIPINKILRIVGSSATECILEGHSDTLFELTEGPTKVSLDLENLTLRSPEGERQCAIKVLKGNLTCKRCIIQARGPALGLMLGPTGFAPITEKTSALISDTELQSDEHASIVVSNRAVLDLQHCRTQSQGDKNIILLSGGQIRLADCEVRGGSLGLSIEADVELPTTATLTNCVLAGQDRAILIRGPGASADLMNSEIQDFLRSGVEITHAGQANLTNCRFQHGEQGIYSWGASQLKIIRVQFSQLARPLVISGSGTKAEIDSCQFSHNNRPPNIVPERPHALVLAEWGARVKVLNSQFSWHSQPLFASLSLALIEFDNLSLPRHQTRQIKENGGQIKRLDR